jgi:hypothetical protein
MRVDEADGDGYSLRLIDEVLDLIALQEPIVRADVVAAARTMLAGGRGPSALDLASMLLIELVDEPRRALGTRPVQRA